MSLVTVLYCKAAGTIAKLPALLQSRRYAEGDVIGGPSDFSVHDCRHRTAMERMAVKGRIAALGERAIHVVSPGALGVKERDVGGRADGKAPAMQVEYAIGARW